jgi:hypothetical protein
LEGRTRTGLPAERTAVHDALDEKLTIGPDATDTEVDDTSGPKLLDRIDDFIGSLADD